MIYKHILHVQHNNTITYTSYCFCRYTINTRPWNMVKFQYPLCRCVIRFVYKYLAFLSIISRYWTSCGLSQWPRGLRRGSAAACLPRLRVRIPLRAAISISFECCVLSGTGLWYGPITRPEESYRMWCVKLSVILTMRKHWASRDVSPYKEKKHVLIVWSVQEVAILVL